ncbi:MAG: hypothetical protein QG639_544 [Patescibacteria group bacterium]|nr:hypothetical protein [Patescibacteria group bacterium]
MITCPSRPSTSVFVVCFFAALSFLSVSPVLAQNCDDIKCEKDKDDEDDSDYLACIDDKRSCLEDKIKETQNQKITLNNTISLISGKINLQELKISQTETEIEKLERQIVELNDRINGLDLSLDRLTGMLVERIRAQYKESRVSPFVALASSGSFSDMFAREQYVNLASEQTALAMQRAELQKMVYDQEKELKELKQKEVEVKRQDLQSEQNVLTKQRGEQQFLLTETQHNEARYQAELAKTLAELNAIQSIIAGKGNESEVGEVESGDKIASIIVGASTCSTGTHLHFEVVKDGVNRDPAAYLKPISILWNNDPDTEFGFGGDWDWPLNDAARITQGYGMTYYARVRRAYGGQPHTGIDMTSKSANYTVKAVEDGKLFRGSIRCGGGFLRYVKVEHEDDGLSSYYLHVNY